MRSGAEGRVECSQFSEDIADEDLDFGAKEDAGGVVAQPEGAGAEFVVGFECVAFFGVHALDFDVEAQGFTRRIGDGDCLGAEGFDIDQKGRSTREDERADFFAFREGLAADEKGGGEEVSDGGNFNRFPLGGFGTWRDPFAAAREGAVVAFDACREGAGVVFFELGRMDCLEAIAGGSSIEAGVELVERAGKSCCGTRAHKGGRFAIVGNGGAGPCGFDLSPAEAVFGKEWLDFGEGSGGKWRNGGLPSQGSGNRKKKNEGQDSHGESRRRAKPSQRLRVDAVIDLFDLRVGLVAVGAEFATYATLLVTAPRGLVEGGVVGIDPSDACAQAPDDALGLCAVLGEDAGGEAVDGVICEADGFFLGIEKLNGENRAENLLAHDAHGGFHGSENRGLHEIPGAAVVIVGSAASEELGPFAAGTLNVVEDFFLVCPGDERTHFRGFLHPWADDDFLGGGGQSGKEIVCKTPLEEQAGAGATDLALTGKNREKRIFQSAVVVGVGEDNIGTLATELERDFFEIRSGSGEDFASCLASTSEGDFIDQRTLGESGPDGRTGPVEQLCDSRRKPNLVDEFEEQRGGEGCEFGRFEDTAIPGRKAWSELPCGHEKWVIPRNDLPADSDRLPHGLANDAGIAHLKGLPLRFCGIPGVVAKAGSGIRHIEARFAEGLAAIARLHFGKLGGAGIHEIGKFEEAGRPLWRWRSRPWTIVERLAGSTDRFVHILHRRLSSLTDL